MIATRVAQLSHLPPPRDDSKRSETAQLDRDRNASDRLRPVVPIYEPTHRGAVTAVRVDYLRAIGQPPSLKGDVARKVRPLNGTYFASAVEPSQLWSQAGTLVPIEIIEWNTTIVR